MSYSNDINQFADFITNANPDAFHPQSVTSSDVRLWMMQLSSQGIALSSIRRKLSALSSFFRFLMRTRGLKANPVADTPAAKLPSRLPVFIRPEEMQEVIESSDPANLGADDDFTSVRNHLIILMFYSTGMRLAELISLSDDNVDTHACELKVHGKRNKDRIIPFGDELAREIQAYRKIRNATIPLPEAPNFFLRPSGEPLYPMLVQRLIKKALCGHTHATRESPHTLRHSFASDMLNNGADISAVRELLGHASLATTQVYTHVTYRELQKNYRLAHPRARKQ